MKVIPTLLADFYKINHKNQYPANTEKIYSTWTPRSGKHLRGVDKVVVFGHQAFIKEVLIETFNELFFNRPKEEVVQEYARVVRHCLFVENPETQHIEDLHDLGYLPLEIKSLEEGTLVPFRTPVLTVENTDPKFFWVTNYIETMMSANLWKPSTTASIALQYRKLLNSYAMKTTGSIAGVEFQGHDFSMRGMGGVEDAARAGAGHLLSFVGTDTIPAISYLEQYYNANIASELIGCSVPATEHSVQSCGGKEDERETYRRLIEDIYPSGIVSIVSDTWDLWNVLTNIIPSLKESILKRSGAPLNKVVIRPDSGNPADIICGDPSAPAGSPASKGVIELLHETFGGTKTEQGYILLNEKIGAIYGDSITLSIAEEICERLAQKGFASTNIVLGIGSFTYQFLTRDSLGFAMKATSATVNGVERNLFKDPITDSGVKKSAKGRVEVRMDTNGNIECFDSEKTDTTGFSENMLKTVFLNGRMVRETSLAAIREKLKNESL